MNLTPKQQRIVELVAAGDDGQPIDLDQLIERVGYNPSKQAFQFSIRSLVDKDLIKKVGIEKRRGRNRVLFEATHMGKHFAGPRPAAGIVSTVEEEDFLDKFS
jgi:repressor of nif and glnA expression